MTLPADTGPDPSSEQYFAHVLSSRAVLPDRYSSVDLGMQVNLSYHYIIFYLKGPSDPDQIGPNWIALQRKSHLCIFFWELRGLRPNFHIHVSLSDLYIPRSFHIFGCSKIDRPILEIYKSLTDI